LYDPLRFSCILEGPRGPLPSVGGPLLGFFGEKKSKSADKTVFSIEVGF
jgi:hypothetical protein